MGRPRKILEFNKKHLTNAEKAERQAAELAYKLRNDQLIAYDGLTDRAKAEFNRIKSLAHWLDNLDLNELILYCFCWDKTLSIIDEYKGRPEVLKVPMADGSSRIISNPLRKALQDYHAEMRAISAKLGLASIDRLKLIAPQNQKPVNKFIEFLG